MFIEYGQKRYRAIIIFHIFNRKTGQEDMENVILSVKLGDRIKIYRNMTMTIVFRKLAGDKTKIYIPLKNFRAFADSVRTLFFINSASIIFS